MNSTFTNSMLHFLDERLANITDELIVSIQISNFLLSIPLNGYLMFLLTRARTLDLSVILSLGQCFSEILYALSAPLYVLCLPVINICYLKLLGFFVGIFMSGHPLFQCCMCLERYLAVVQPIIFLKFRPVRYRLGFLFVIWTFLISLCFIVIMTFPSVPYAVFGGFYVIILAVEFFCCVSILKVLKQPSPGHREIVKDEIRKNNIKEKAYKVVSFSLLIFLIQSTPVGIVISLRSTVFNSVFYSSITICMAINIVSRLTQALFHIRTVGKLTFPRCS